MIMIPGRSSAFARRPREGEFLLLSDLSFCLQTGQAPAPVATQTSPSAAFRSSRPRHRVLLSQVLYLSVSVMGLNNGQRNAASKRTVKTPPNAFERLLFITVDLDILNSCFL